MIKKKKFLFLGILIALVLIIIIVVYFSFSVFYFKTEFGKGKVIVSGKAINVDVALTAEAQYQGLQGKNSLANNEGMLFVFKEKHYQNFWMQGMKFPIDIIWLDDNKIIGFVENAPVPKDSNNIPTYTSPSEVNYVLEVKSGFVKENNIKVGDNIEYKL